MWFRIVSALVILSLLTIGIFGMWGMMANSHGAHSSCPISLLTLGNCPDADLAVYNNHLSVLSYFAQGSVSLNQLGLLAALALLAIALLAFISADNNLLAFKCRVVRNYKLKSARRRQFLHWLAHTHNRLPTQLFRVYETA